MGKYVNPENHDEVWLDTDKLFKKLTNVQMEALEYEVKDEMIKRGYTWKRKR